MNTQKLVKLMSATRGRRVVPMAIVAFCMAAAVPSMAAQRNWKGNGANTYWNTSGNWDTQPGGSDSLQFRTSGVKNMTATLNGSYTYSGNIHMGNGSSAANPYIWEATDPANKLTIKDDTWLGYYENGWLWIKSGTYVFNDTAKKNFHMGEGASGATRNFWLRVGDGTSTVSVTARNGYIRGGSTLVADAATLKFTESLYFSETGSMVWAIVYWDLSDAYTWQPKLYGSFLRRDMSPKPAYKVICDLVGREWRTNFERDAPGGRLSFRGFCGTYEVEATSNGRTVKRQFHVGNAASAPVEMSLA